MSDKNDWNDDKGNDWNEKKQQARNINWEKSFIEKIALSGLQEQKRSRRWGIFFKSLTFLYLFVFMFVLFQGKGSSRVHTSSGGKHTAIIDVVGVISDASEASADKIISGLRDAFDDKNTQGVILRLNSPGGSPVQSGYVNDEIYRLRELHPDIPLYAVVTDLCASGCYYIAAAADVIYVDKASMVGSIGVLMNGFGFVDVLQKLGVERRLLTAGEHKGLLDPFSPLKIEEKAHIQTLLDEIHQQFINVVKKGRGEKLDESQPLFSGLIWSGEQAIKIGLADEVSSSSKVARDVVKAEDLVDFTYRENPVDRIFKGLGVEFGRGALESLSQKLSLQ